MGTLTRADDTMADYSSRGPTYIDYAAKPDLVAPGTGTVSLAAPGSTFYATKSTFLLAGSSLLNLGYKPYLALSGTSMSAPVVSGTVALMLQANPNLTPNLVKAILQYTAQVYPGYRPLEEGAGFLNTYGAVRLAKFLGSAKVGDQMPVQSTWSRQIFWGNQRLKGGYLNPRGSAWTLGTLWGGAKSASGTYVTWGAYCGSCDNVVWGSFDLDNIVWGSFLGGDNIVWGSFLSGDNIVWGSSWDDNIVWGSSCGGGDCDNVVWGSFDAADNIVWGSCFLGDNIVWGSSGIDNIVWASSADTDVTWGSSGDATDAVVFDDSAPDVLPSVQLQFGDLVPLVDPNATTTTSTSTSTVPGGGL
jgi:hypothetical protein